MAETSSPRSPLTRLVLFIVCISIAGAFLAGVHYFTVDLPQQQEVQQRPTNTDCSNVCLLVFSCLQEDGNTQAACYQKYASCADQLEFCPMM